MGLSVHEWVWLQCNDASIGEVQGLLKGQPEQGFLEDLTFQLQLNDYQKSSALTEGVGAKSIGDISKSRGERVSFSLRKGQQLAGQPQSLGDVRKRPKQEAGHSLRAHEPGVDLCCAVICKEGPQQLLIQQNQKAACGREFRCVRVKHQRVPLAKRLL